MDLKKQNQEKIDSSLRSLGFLYPQTEIELKRLNELYSDFDYELTGLEVSTERIFSEVKNEECKTNSGKSDATVYFKRVVLAAEIANQLHSEPTFGHVKFQKLVFLCEYRCRMKLSERYCKQAAGPFDRKFMHSIDNEFFRQQWFEVKQESNFNRFVYNPLPKIDNYKQYYNRYFSKDHSSIQSLLDLFRKEKTHFVEMVATLFACWDESLQRQEDTSEGSLISKFYMWSKEKERFQRKELQSAIEWMEENEVVPVQKIST